MRLLAVTSHNDRSEIAMYRGLARAGIELDLTCAPGSPGRDELAESGITVEELAIKHRLDFGAARVIRRKLLQEKYDAIYAPSNRSLAVSLIASRGMKLGRVAYRGTCGHVKRWYPGSWLTYLNPRLDRIVCVSNAVREYLLTRGLPESRLVTIHKGHDPAWYDVPNPAALREFGIPDGAFVAGFAGAMRPVKGVDVLLGSAMQLPPSLNTHLLLVGHVRHPRVEKLARDPRLKDRVHFTGFRRDAAALMGACNVFVMPSVDREGLPRAVIEAMAQRVPVIVSNVGGMPELVVDGECGKVVPPRDAKALAEALTFFAREPEQARVMGARGRERIETHFHISATIERMTALFRDLAA